MAFTYAVTKQDATKSQRLVVGTYTQASGDTGGDIVTGLKSCVFLGGTGVLTTAISAGTVTITTADPGAAQTGHWMALGY